MPVLLSSLSPMASLVSSMARMSLKFNPVAANFLRSFATSQGSSDGPSASSGGYSASSNQDEDFKPSIARSVVDIRRTAKVTKGGKIISFSVMVVVGNGRGGAGYGLGKALSMAEATRKATVKATKAMTFIPRYHNSTIYHQIDHNFHKTRIRLFPADIDYGIRTHHAIQSICHCAGIQAMGGKVYGSRNVINVVRGTFEALEGQETHLERARRLGLKAIDMHQTTFDREMEANERYNQMQLDLLKAKLSKKGTFKNADDEVEPKKKRSPAIAHGKGGHKASNNN